MEIITKEQFLELEHVYFEQIINDAVFVYPTDTIYGIGCDATNAEAVKKIREIKKRNKKPFSVIAPSKGWIRENCEVTDLVEKNLQKLPGQYTLILKLKNKCIAKEVTEGSTIGVRIPKHWIADVVKELNKPIVTTSVNVLGELPLQNVDQIPAELCDLIDFAIDVGPLTGKPSTILDVTGKEEKKLR